MRDLHFTISKAKTSPEGKPVQALGIKVGYWPCLKAPFVSLCVSNRIIDLWWGEPSYLQTAHWTWSLRGR